MLVPAFVMAGEFAECRDSIMGHGQLRPAINRQQVPGHCRDDALEPLMRKRVNQLVRRFECQNIAPHQFSIFFIIVKAEVLK